MAIKNVFTYPRFDKNYRKLPIKIKKQAEEKEKLFRENPFNSSLKTRKLSGKEKESWAFSINNRYRIKFIFLSSVEVLFLDIGTHSIYK